MTTYRESDAFEHRILEEIARYVTESDVCKIRIETLRGLLPNGIREGASVSAASSPIVREIEKPHGFILTEAIANALKNHPGEFVAVDTIFQEIVTAANGFLPNRKSFNITLGVWKKNNRLLQDGVKSAYRLAD